MTVRIFDGVDIATSGTQFYTGYTAEELAQNVRTRLRHFLGEWFLDVTSGTPWWPEQPGAILGKSTSLATKEATLKRRIMQAPGFGSMTSFALDFERASRTLTVSCSIISLSGVEADLTESLSI